jgi:hypothetical protein
MKSPEFNGKDVLLDANLLVVFLIGLTRSSLFGKKPVSEYNISDFEILRAISRICRSCLTTPYLIAETSNLVSKASDFYAEECREKLGEILHFWVEEYSPGQALFNTQNQKVSIQFGVADASIMELARRGATVLTADYPLASLLASENLDVWHIDTLRALKKAIW